MGIDFDYEVSEMTPDLQQAEGYLECEKIIVNNVRKHDTRGLDDKVITNYLKNFPLIIKTGSRHHKTKVIVPITGMLKGL